MQIHILHKSRPLGFLLAASFAALFSVAPALLGQTTSTISGRITDKQGLAIAGAEIHVVGKTVVADHSVQSDTEGAYRVPALPAGAYTLTVSHEGFRQQVLTGLEVTLNRTLNIDVQLEVGSTHEQIQVTGE